MLIVTEVDKFNVWDPR